MRERTNRNIKVDIEERFSRDIVRALRDGRRRARRLWDTVDFDGASAARLTGATSSRWRSTPATRWPAAKSLASSETLDHEQSACSPTPRCTACCSAPRPRPAAPRLPRDRVEFRRRVPCRRSQAGRQRDPDAGRLGLYAFADVKLVPLTDDWASRRFAVCFRDQALLQPAALRMLDYSGGKGGRLTGRQAGIHRFSTIRRHFPDIYR